VKTSAIISAWRKILKGERPSLSSVTCNHGDYPRSGRRDQQRASAAACFASNLTCE